MNNLGNVVNASRRACYCNQFQTVLSKVRSAVRQQKQQRDKVLNNLTAERTEKVFPFRGLVGPASERNVSCVKKNPPFQFFLTTQNQEVSRAFGSANLQESHLSAVQSQVVVNGAMPYRRPEQSANVRIESDQVECVVQECSEKTRQSLADLFPGGYPDQVQDKMTAVIISHKTKKYTGKKFLLFQLAEIQLQSLRIRNDYSKRYFENDMGMWSAEMELEREELTAQFVEIAKEIVDALKGNDVWGDFIDPSSGRPYYSPYTNSTLFETDDRYRHFGFTVQDLGCCKCLEHPIWGANTFVGCILTSASSNHPILKEILQNHVEL